MRTSQIPPSIEFSMYSPFQSFESTVTPILNKPKPKEKTPPPANNTAGDGQPAAGAPESQNTEQMDVD